MIQTGAEVERTGSWPWLLLYAALTLVLLLPLSLDMHRRLPDDSDALQNLWIVWWGATHLELGYPAIYEANGYYPNPLPLVYSEPQFSQALLSWPFFTALDNRVLSYNLLVALSLCLSAFGAHLFLRELIGSSSAAFVGAMVYAFSCYSFSQLARSQLVSLQWMPLALLYLHRFFSRGRPLALTGFAVFSVLLGLACFYYLQFYLVALAVIVPAYLLVYRCWQKPRMVVWLGVSFALIAAPLMAAAAPYFRLFQRYGFTGQADSYDLIRFFQPPAGNPLYGVLDPPAHSLDQFLGFFALCLGAVGIWSLSRDRRETRWLGVTWVLLGLLSFFLAGGPDLIVNGERLSAGPYRILQFVKPLGNLRDPHRFGVITRLSLSLLVAAGAARLAAGRSAGRGALVSASLAGLIVMEQWSPRHTRGTEIPVGDAIPEAYRALDEEPNKGPVAELPVRPFRFIRFNTLESYFSTFHERPILVGKPSFPPPAFELLRWELRDFPDRKSITLLQSLGVERVLVHPKRWEDEGKRFLRGLARWDGQLSLVREFPDRANSLWDRYELGAEQLYALAPLEEPGVPRSCECREIDRGTFRLKANGANDPSLAVDGDPSTKWTTGSFQQEGFFFEIEFDRLRRPTRVEIEMTFPYEEFARNLELNGFRGPRFWRLQQIEDRWYTVALIRKLVDDPNGARLRYDLEAMDVDRVRLFIHRTEEGAHGWSIAEIHVYESATEGGAPDVP